MRSQLGMARLATLITITAPVAEGASQARRDAVRPWRSAARQARRDQTEYSNISSRDRARPASTASGGAAGSRYSKPFTGQIVKNSTGTMTQARSSDSRHVASPRIRIRPISATMRTAGPIHDGSTVA